MPITLKPLPPVSYERDARISARMSALTGTADAVTARVIANVGNSMEGRIWREASKTMESAAAMFELFGKQERREGKTPRQRWRLAYELARAHAQYPASRYSRLEP